MNLENFRNFEICSRQKKKINGGGTKWVVTYIDDNGQSVTRFFNSQGLADSWANFWSAAGYQVVSPTYTPVY